MGLIFKIKFEIRAKNQQSDLVVDESPLLEEGVYADHRADVAGQVPPAGRRGEVLGRVEAVRVDHEVAVAQINLGGLLGKI